MENDMKAPKITPLEAVALFGDDRGQEIYHREGDTVWCIIMDGPMGSPSEAWAPCAILPNDTSYYATGEPGDTVDENTTWVGPF
jgi:hypothetical protein